MSCRYYLDRRAARILQSLKDHLDDEKLDSAELAELLEVTVAWCSQARIIGYGPKFTQAHDCRVTYYYRVGDLREWLVERADKFANKYVRQNGRTLLKKGRL